MTRHFTSESVTAGHPDKVADRISDAVLDAILAKDPEARVACETMITPQKVIVAGETTNRAGQLDFEEVIRSAIRDIGYTYDDIVFRADNVEIEMLLGSQSDDIAGGVTRSLEARQGSKDPLDQLGAGDQGMMFGYANRDTEELMPAPIHLAHQLAARLTEVREDGLLDYLRPDGKTQVTVAYKGSKPVRVERVLISSHHDAGVKDRQMAKDLKEKVLRKIDSPLISRKTTLLVNPSGSFLKGGPEADAGLTGRKIIVDTYGGFARHGGGAFSGKDPTKVDRSAAYFARYVAKNVVASGLAEQCEIQVSYAIGQARPFSVYVDSFGTSEIDPAKLEKVVKEFFDFRPAAIINTLKLRQFIYAKTSALGHFGRAGFPWESTEQAHLLRRAAERL